MLIREKFNLLPSTRRLIIIRINGNVAVPRERKFIKEKERNVIARGRHLSVPNKSFLCLVVTDNLPAKSPRASPRGSVTKTESGCHLTREGESL